MGIKLNFQCEILTSIWKQIHNVWYKKCTYHTPSHFNIAKAQGILLDVCWKVICVQLCEILCLEICLPLQWGGIARQKKTSELLLLKPSLLCLSSQSRAVNSLWHEPMNNWRIPMKRMHLNLFIHHTEKLIMSKEHSRCVSELLRYWCWAVF